MATASVLGDGDLTSSTVMETVTGTVGSSAHAVQMSLYHHAQSTIFVLWAWCRSVALSSALAAIQHIFQTLDSGITCLSEM